MTEEKLREHREAMLNHLKRRNTLLLMLSDLIDRLDRYQMTMQAHHRYREGGKLLIEATDMLHRIVEEVIGDAIEIETPAQVYGSRTGKSKGRQED